MSNLEGLGLWYLCHFQQCFSYVSFIGWWNVRKPLTCLKSPTNIIAYSCIEYTSPWAEFEPKTLVVIGTDFISSCKSNYHTITATTASQCVIIIQPKHMALIFSNFTNYAFQVWHILVFCNLYETKKNI